MEATASLRGPSRGATPVKQRDLAVFSWYRLLLLLPSPTSDGKDASLSSTVAPMRNVQLLEWLVGGKRKAEQPIAVPAVVLHLHEGESRRKKRQSASGISILKEQGVLHGAATLVAHGDCWLSERGMWLEPDTRLNSVLREIGAGST